ncbi:hypothetical protein AC1031_011147 [Aphanomyces cochlioides]|nr:hypothetical protein AC1031_011147 [Aphanomyces cochlioides]
MDLTSDDYPTDSTLSRIMEAIDSTPGNVAVHGVEHAGVYLGGYLMRAYGFSAQEATGWLFLSGVVGKIFPQMLIRWERGWSNETFWYKFAWPKGEIQEEIVKVIKSQRRRAHDKSSTVE